LDDRETGNEAEELVLGIKFPTVFPEDKQHLFLNKFRYKDSQTMYEIVQQEVFPFKKDFIPIRTMLIQNI
jgi:type I restriction enzyme M protein